MQMLTSNRRLKVDQLGLIILKINDKMVIKMAGTSAVWIAHENA